MRSLTITTITAALFAGQLIPATGQQQEPRAPYVLGVTHLHISITTWSDGSLDVSDSRVLTASSARRLANRLEDVENERRQLKQSRRLEQRANNQHAEDPVQTASRIDTQCTAIAKSTGNRCRNNVKAGNLGNGRPFCYVHIGQSKP